MGRYSLTKMLRDIDQFYLKQEEPNRSCFEALRQVILDYDDLIDEALKYGLPMFAYKKKSFCYLWKDKVTKMPYIGIVKGGLIEHELLIQGKRKKIKILSIDPMKDIPVELIYEIFNQAKMFYK